MCCPTGCTRHTECSPTRFGANDASGLASEPLREMNCRTDEIAQCYPLKGINGKEADNELQHYVQRSNRTRKPRSVSAAPVSRHRRRVKKSVCISIVLPSAAVKRKFRKPVEFRRRAADILNPHCVLPSIPRWERIAARWAPASRC